MKSSTQVRITAYAVLGVYSLVLFALNIHLPSVASRVLGLLPLVILGAFALYDTWLWKQGALLRIAKQPLLEGTWTGTLTSYRRDGHDKPITTQHRVVVVVRQTLTALSISMITEQSRSRSTIAQVTMPDRDDFVVQYQYRNDPGLAYRDASPIHPGGAEIRVSGSQPTEMDGEYWTARESRGTFHLKRVSPRHATSFNDGTAMAVAAQGDH
jgi:hypothetical protein